MLDCSSFGQHDAGAVDLKPLITHVYPIEEVGRAFQALEDRTAIRPIVEL